MHQMRISNDVREAPFYVAFTTIYSVLHSSPVDRCINDTYLL